MKVRLGSVALLALSVTTEVLQKRLLKEQPADPQVALTAKARVQARLETAYGKLQAQVARINDLPDGRDFFEKDLRPVLPANTGR